MKRKEWTELFVGQPPGLSVAELARRFKLCPQNVGYWAKKLGYTSVDGRKNPNPTKFASMRKCNLAAIDWSKPNCEIAKEHGISRQRVHQLRKRQPLSKI